MKANLPQNEPKLLERWQKIRIYDLIRKSRAGSPTWVLHDGPPYANGAIHLGHALNKCLKDFIVKSRTMAGFDSPYVPGWDCHGLPIEIKVDEALGRKKLEMDPLAVRNACRAYAEKYVKIQSDQFERIGVFGDFDNPYSTMEKGYESKVIENFYAFLEKGLVFKGLRPVYWCINDRTALAEAEVEYANHTSPSVYVKYALKSDVAAIAPELATYAGKVSTIIWTTTPWTLPASMAVAFHPRAKYQAILDNATGQVYIVAADLAPVVLPKLGIADSSVVASFPGAKLERVVFAHPFLDRDILGVLADYVTMDTGTGAVHTAPAHGADDFYTGVRYGIDQTCHVDAGGHLREGLPEYDGLTVFKANRPIVELLKARGVLLATEDIEHSYPHCWRCHKPVIFRATEQWFIGLETEVEREDASKTTFRQLAIEEIDKVVWDPSWGKERITNMIATRPDWCISRQRIWGVPIAVFLCENCNKPVIDQALNRAVVNLFEHDGVEAWHSPAADSLLRHATTCAHCGGKAFRKETDILDVWFDSGTSWFAVAEVDPDLKDAYTAFQNDEGVPVLYLEGGDQHRGWFHSSLLTSVALRGRAPYSNVATAGWTLDEQGRAMSKSLGNGVDPVDIANRLGGEIVRLWVASVDFREDMAASENLMQRCADIYRKLRNTFRFLLGNLNGFDPARDRVAEAELLPLDRYMLARTRELTEKIREWYTAFEFHRVYHAVNEFCIVDLSSFYLDVLKDRMYTFAPTSQARLSAQTVLWQITETLVRLVAPILSFTADEVWEYLPMVEGREASVHLAQFPKPEEVFSKDPAKLLEEWKQIFAVRDDALRVLEEARQAKRIGKGLEAELEIAANGPQLELLKRHADGLKEIVNVSKVTVIQGPTPQVTALPASGHKCARCWNFMPEVSNYGIWENVCTRCHGALMEMGIKPPLAQETELTK
jgi:isoleucyl-tRNA synthetase